MELLGIEPATLGLENRWRTAFGSSDSSLFFGPDGDECVGRFGCEAVFRVVVLP